jgi:hypothetical protein
LSLSAIGVCAQRPCQWGGALRGERGRAFDRVGGFAQILEEIALDGDAGGQRQIAAAHHGLANLLHSERRRPHDGPGDRLALRHQRIGRHHVIDEAQPQRFRRIDAAARVQQLQRTAERDQPRQSLRAAAAGQQADQHFAEAQLRVFGGHADVAGQRLFEAAAVTVAIDGDDDRLGHRREHGKQRIRRFAVGAALAVVRLDVAAHAERALTAAGEDGDAQRGIVAEALPGASELPVGLEVAGIQAFRAVDRHVSDRAARFEQDFAHRHAPSVVHA